MRELNIEIGQKYGLLTVIKRVENYVTPKGVKHSKYLCRCECGTEVEAIGSCLAHKRKESCGCLQKKRAYEVNLKHGMAGTRLYNIWDKMKSRCYKESNNRYNRYGGRGITVCNEWKNDFQAFYDWAIANGYNDELTIDRIDVNGNYEPSNCQWLTTSENTKKMFRDKKGEKS